VKEDMKLKDMKLKFENGQKVKDTISGLEGTITCVAIYLNGCIRYAVQPGLDTEGHHQESEVIDEQQLVLLEDIKKKETDGPGGDRPFFPKYKL